MHHFGAMKMASNSIEGLSISYIVVKSVLFDVKNHRLFLSFSFLIAANYFYEGAMFSPFQV